MADADLSSPVVPVLPRHRSAARRAGVDAGASADPSVRVCVLTGLGINTEREMAHAFGVAGATPRVVHFNDLAAEPEALESFTILALPGGFSYGDHIGSGAMLAARMARYLADPLRRYVDRGGLVLGVCNGFQVLVRLGMLPAKDGKWSQQVALVHNDSGRFEDRWVRVTFGRSRCIWTGGLAQLDLPVRHGEGRLVVDDQTLATIDERGLVAARYTTPGGATPHNDAPYPANPNGSRAAIAGLCDPTGQVFGLMPHPEAYLYPQLHPLWRRRHDDDGTLQPTGDALQLFRNAVAYVQRHR